MTLELLNDEVQNYINSNLKVSISKLALQKNPFPDVNFKEILNQIESKNKAQKKLPTWFITDKIIYPSKISIEQTSSDITSKYKSQLINGESLIDLTGGFGVDCYYFAKRFKHVIHCEINQELSTIVNHNYDVLHIENISCKNGDSLEILQNINQNFSWIYIDPSRRNENKGKVFLLKDCLPNVPENLDFYLNYSDKILIKTAPILDISAGLLALKNVNTIHIVAVENEVKELLWVVEKNIRNDIEIKTINFNKESKEEFSFFLNQQIDFEYGMPTKYLYEPNAAIMKSGGFNEVAHQFKLKKLHQHSHLFTSDDLKTFPGRIFEINKIISYSKIEMKENLQNIKSNITCRNFPETVEQIKKKWKINDGGNLYSFFTTDVNDNKIVLICTKI